MTTNLDKQLQMIEKCVIEHFPDRMKGNKDPAEIAVTLLHEYNQIRSHDQPTGQLARVLNDIAYYERVCNKAMNEIIYKDPGEKESNKKLQQINNLETKLRSLQNKKERLKREIEEKKNGTQ